MNEKQATIIAILFSILGLLGIYFLLLFYEDFNQENLLQLQGEIVKRKELDGLIIYEIKTNDAIPVISKDGNFKKGDQVLVYGRLQEYKGKVEIIAKKIIS